MLSSLTTRAIILILGFLFLTFTFIVILYGLTAESSRPDLLHTLANAVPSVMAAIPAIIAMLFAKDAKSSSQNAETMLNGTLDARIKEATKSALKEHQRALDAQSPDSAVSD